jgi:PAS domain-containing protein
VARTSELDLLLACGLGRRLLDAVMDAVPACAVLVTAPEGRIVRLSAYAARIFGAPREGIEGRTLKDLVDEIRPTDAQGRLLEVGDLPLGRALRGQTVIGFRGVLPTGHGSRALVASNAAPLHGEDGTVIGALSTLSDMTLFETLIQELMADGGRPKGA